MEFCVGDSSVGSCDGKKSEAKRRRHDDISDGEMCCSKKVRSGINYFDCWYEPPEDDEDEVNSGINYFDCWDEPPEDDVDCFKYWEEKEDDESVDETLPPLAEPLIRCAWSGDFDVQYDDSILWRRIYSFSAFVSNKACQKVHDVATALDQVLHLEMLPRASVWPKAFRKSGGPTDQDIALYFFPPLPLHQQLYDALLFEMVSRDLAMRAFVGDSELLVFNSGELPRRSEVYQGNFYLWGVFRVKISRKKN